MQRCNSNTRWWHVFLLECPRHQSLRSRLIGRYYWNRPSMLKLQQLLNSTCTNVIRAVAKFVYKAFNDLWFYVIQVCRFCTFWYPVAILCNCVRHADQMFLSRMTFVRARGPKTIIKSLNPWIHVMSQAAAPNHHVSLYLSSMDQEISCLDFRCQTNGPLNWTVFF